MTRSLVTPELREQVFERDRDTIKRELFDRWPRWYTEWFGDRMMLGDTPVCPAIVIDRKELGKCWGRWTLDHINQQATRGKRAPSDPAHLISLCEGHTENGMKAGRQWNTANRPALRAYLEES